ncbi:unnamed protein product [Adineta ricciae]|uniref:Uncharacterized protein n=1 Tax=Adineta ricciae TaxID=249248 RepID=A0A816BAX9_ADIRI|nr:unnamed protein product [Adineta ricciae]CAF1609047.1 unnamed protein product [Adineta ricciae]
MATAMDITEVPLYASDEEEEDMNKSVHAKYERAKRKQHKWIKEMVFNNVSEADQAILNEGIFRCNKVKRRGKQCDSSIYLLFNSINEEVILFRNTSYHTHDLVEQKCTRIPSDVKTLIKELHELKLKPKAIIDELYERGIIAPRISQLRNYLRTLTTEKYGSRSISLGEIEEWCIESSRLIPESDDEAFVVSYEIVYDDSGDDTANDDDDDDD